MKGNMKKQIAEEKPVMVTTEFRGVFFGYMTGHVWWIDGCDY